MYTTDFSAHTTIHYPYLVARGSIDRLGDIVQERLPAVSQVVVISDERVAELHWERIAASLRNVTTDGLSIIAFTPGESAKTMATVEWLIDNARSLGIRRAIPLSVAGAFHSPFMASAAERLEMALAETAFSVPAFPVYANTTARPVADPARQLVEQLVEPVLFASTLEHMAEDGITTFIHIGPGDVTAGLVKRTLPHASVHVVSNLEEVVTVATDPSIQ